MVALQKVVVVIIGVIAFFLAIRMKSVLAMAYFAYTIYGVSITPALIAALAWKRATRLGGLVSIISGTASCIFLRIMVEVLGPEGAPGGDPWGIPIIYYGVVISVGSLIIVSLLTPKPDAAMLEKFFPKKTKT